VPESLSEVQEFMDREPLAGFATVNRKNEPHLVPVFFTYKDGKVCVQTDRDPVKVRNLRNRNVAVAVFKSEEAVIIGGKGRVVEEDDGFARRIEDHVEKYRLKLDSQGRDSLGIPLFDKKIRCVIEVAADRTLYW
jgi:nitroimidazol reductase NimA-like FMN-containing flavoprotein (pyridoxamine 5'-phosphate oxidase superfamily)